MGHYRRKFITSHLPLAMFSKTAFFLLVLPAIALAIPSEKFGSFKKAPASDHSRVTQRNRELTDEKIFPQEEQRDPSAMSTAVNLTIISRSNTSSPDNDDIPTWKDVPSPPPSRTSPFSLLTSSQTATPPLSSYTPLSSSSLLKSQYPAPNRTLQFTTKIIEDADNYSHNSLVFSYLDSDWEGNDSQNYHPDESIFPFIEPSEEQLITNAFSDHPLSIEYWGLQNSNWDCYLNSALQALRVIFKSLSQKDQLSIVVCLQKEYQENLFQDQAWKPIYALGSPLATFLQDKFDGREAYAASFLRQEIQDIMLRKQSISQAAQEIKNSLDSATGESLHQGDASVALAALMECLNIPHAHFQEEDTDVNTGASRNTQTQYGNEMGDLIIPLAISTSCLIQKLITENFSSELSDVQVSSDGRHNFTRKKLLTTPPNSITFSLSRFRLKPDPQGGWAQNSKGEDIIGTPKLFINAQGYCVPEKLDTPIIGTLGDIFVPLVNNNAATQQNARYTPSAIICHGSGISANSGHYIAFVHEGNNWHLINDHLVFRIDTFNQVISPTENPLYTYKDFIDQNAYIISYRYLATK